MLRISSLRLGIPVALVILIIACELGGVGMLPRLGLEVALIAVLGMLFYRYRSQSDHGSGTDQSEARVEISQLSNQLIDELDQAINSVLKSVDEELVRVEKLLRDAIQVLTKNFEQLGKMSCCWPDILPSCSKF